MLLGATAWQNCLVSVALKFRRVLFCAFYFALQETRAAVAQNRFPYCIRHKSATTKPPAKSAKLKSAIYSSLQNEKTEKQMLGSAAPQEYHLCRGR